MSQLHRIVDEYLDIRRGLGFKLEREGYLLNDFATYLERAGATIVTTELALAWAQQPVAAHPSWWGARLSEVRVFARHLHALDDRHQVPPADLLPARSQRATPYLYSQTDVIALMAAAGTRTRSSLMAATYATYIGLLATTGMRAGEAIALDGDDVDWAESLLIVRSGKFGKSREVVLDLSTMAALRAYDHQRCQICPRPKTPAFFVSTTGTRLLYKNVQFIFHRLVAAAGLEPRSERCRPRLHDLRHTFAVNTLVGWYRDGLDVASRMYLLSTYLGHLDPANTYWYLSATPELLALAGQRLERQLGELP
jgi:integrase